MAEIGLARGPPRETETKHRRSRYVSDRFDFAGRRAGAFEYSAVGRGRFGELGDRAHANFAHENVEVEYAA
jgi:hypothetical protein